MQLSIGLSLSGQSGVAGPSAPSLFPFTLYNEAGSAVITAMPALRVRINGGAWQTLAAAGLTIANTPSATDKLRVSGLTGAETSVEFHFEQQQTGEPYSAVDTVGTANTTGTSISSIYARHSTSGKAPVVPLLPGIPIAPTRAAIPVVAA